MHQSEINLIQQSDILHGGNEEYAHLVEIKFSYLTFCLVKMTIMPIWWKLDGGICHSAWSESQLCQSEVNPI